MIPELKPQGTSLGYLFTEESTRSLFLKIILFILALTGVAHLIASSLKETGATSILDMFAFGLVYVTLGTSAILIYLNRFQWAMSVVVTGLTIVNLGLVLLTNQIPSHVFISAFNLIMMGGILVSPKAGVYTFFAFAFGILTFEAGLLDDLALLGVDQPYDLGNIPEILTLLFSVPMVAFALNRASKLLQESHRKTIELSQSRKALVVTTELNVLRAREGSFTAQLAQNMMRASSPGQVFDHFREQIDEGIGPCEVAAFQMGANAWTQLNSSAPSSGEHHSLPAYIARHQAGVDLSKMAEQLLTAFENDELEDGVGVPFQKGVLWKVSIQEENQIVVVVMPSLEKDGFSDQERRQLETFLSLAHVALINLRVVEQFRQAQKLEAVGLLGRGIAHEFNNYLTTISGNVEMALVGAKDDEGISQRLQKIGLAVEQASSLTRKLLMMGQDGDWRPEEVNVNTTIARIVRMMEVDRPEHMVVKLNLDAASPRAHLDKNSLETALFNLLVNAQESIVQEEGIIQVTTKMEHDVGPSGTSFVSISIRDNGIGMSENEKERIFTPFFTTRPKEKGTGLGLSSVVELMDQSGGVCHLTSARGMGSTFELRIPAYLREPAELGHAETTETDDQTGHMELILVVEDEQHVRNTIVEMLTQARYKTLEASSVQQAKALMMKRQDIALVLSDILMPGETGLDLLQQIKEMDSPPALILMTGFSYEWPDSVEATLLNKPFSMSSLLSTVSDKLDSSASPA